MQFHRQQQPRFMKLGDRLINIYAIVDILPFQIQAPNHGTDPIFFHQVSLTSGEWLKVLGNEDKKAIEAILLRQGINVEALREEALEAYNNRRHSLV